MSVGVLPHVVDPRPVEQRIADFYAHERARHVRALHPQIEAVTEKLAALVPGFAAMTAEDRFVVALAVVEAVEAGF